jgi:putative oxidoreductase
MELWGDTHHPKWLDFVRIALGIFLCYKGVDFLMNMSQIQGMLSSRLSFGDFAVFMVAHFVSFAHIAGGFLLVIGVLTRFACIIQIPILLGAVILINFSREVFQPYSEIVLSIVVLLLLIFFLIVGNGPLSVHLPTDEEQRSH